MFAGVSAKIDQLGVLIPGRSLRSGSFGRNYRSHNNAKEPAQFCHFHTDKSRSSGPGGRARNNAVLKWRPFCQRVADDRVISASRDQTAKAFWTAFSMSPMVVLRTYWCAPSRNSP